MTAIFLDDTFYLIDNMGIDEILEIANKEGLNSPKLRAKAVMQLSVDFYNSSMIKSYLPQIKSGLFQLADKYLVKPISTIEELEYFTAPDNKKYTCDMAYYVVAKSNTNVEPPTVVQPTVYEITDVEEELEINNPVVSQNSDEERIEKIDEATFLDTFLSKCHKISSFLSETELSDVERYMSFVKEELDKEVKKPFLEEARIDTIIDGNLGENIIENAVGNSNNMLDSLLVFPVYSAIVGRRNLKEKFSMLALEGSEFVRFCPVGVDENGEAFGFVHMISLTSPLIGKIERDVKTELKKTGKKFASLTAGEKYQMFEERLFEYYSKNSGKMLMASGSRKYVNLTEFMNNMFSKKYVVPQLKRDDNEILWPCHEIVAFDNRGSKTLKEQVEELYEQRIDSAPRFIQTPLEGENEEAEVLDSVVDAPLTLDETSSSLIKFNMNLFESLVNNNVVGDSSLLVLHNGSGEVVSEISTKKTAPKPEKKGITPGVLNPDVLVETITMENKNDIKMTGFGYAREVDSELETIRKR